MTNSEKPIVTIFGSDECFHCLRCKQLCEAMQIEHGYLDIYNDQDAYTLFKKVFPEAEGIPKILWHSERLEGYDDLASKINDFITNDGESDE